MREVNRERDSQLKAGTQENGSAHQRLAESQRSRRPVTKNPAERRRRSPRCNRCWPLQGINRSATWCSFTLDTFRAFIKINSLLADGRALFDVAVAGPLTWLVFAISALLIGLRFSVVIPGNGGSSLDQAGLLHRVIGPAGVSGQHVFGSIGARGHSRGDQRINPGREDVGYCPSRTLLCRGCECRTACFLSEDGSATTNPPNSQPAMISAMSPPEPQLIQIDRDDQGHEESDSNHDIPASSQRQSELELSLHFPLPLSPDNLLHNSNN